MDKAGNIVVSTQTINGWFGSALVAQGTGIVLNNEMDDFAASVGVELISLELSVERIILVEPKKRHFKFNVTNNCIKRGKIQSLALGTPNGTRILTCVAQTILNYIEHQLPLWDAVAATRYHHQWYPDEIRVDKPFFDINTEKHLQAMGHKVAHKPFGCSIQAISYEKGKLHGVSDMRGYGLAHGK
jgi:gamma-glutamyltranspeptidase/glutathione hydrolase